MGFSAFGLDLLDLQRHPGKNQQKGRIARETIMHPAGLVDIFEEPGQNSGIVFCERSLAMTKKVGLTRKIWRRCLAHYYAALHNPKTMEVYKRVLRKLPVQSNKIVMDNYDGMGYGENPKYIAEELLKRDRRYKIIWLTRDNQSDYPKGIKPVFQKELTDTAPYGLMIHKHNANLGQKKLLVFFKQRQVCA